MAVEKHDLRIVEFAGATPDFLIDDDENTITYVYSGDPAELAVLGQHAGEFLARRRQIPVIPNVE